MRGAGPIVAGLALALGLGCGGGGGAVADAGATDADGPAIDAPPDAIDPRAPVVTLGSPSPALVNATATVTVTVDYEDALAIDLTAADVVLTATSGDPACSSVTVTDGTTAHATVAITGCTGDGELALSIAPGTSTGVGDVPDAGAGPSAGITVDNTPPEVRVAPAQVTAASPGTVSFGVEYLGATAIALDAGGVVIDVVPFGVTCAGAAVTDGTTATPTVTLTGCAGEGLVRIRIRPGTSTDTAGNADLGSGPSASTWMQPSTGSLPQVGHLGGHVLDVAVTGTSACVAKGRGGLVVMSLADPALPAYVTTLDTTAVAGGIDVAGSYAYLADGQNGLRVIDISTPATPAIVATRDTTSWAERVVVDGRYAFVADRYAGLAVIDVGTPTAPVTAGTADTRGASWGVAIDATHAFLADGENGLVIVDRSALPSP